MSIVWFLLFQEIYHFIPYCMLNYYSTCYLKKCIVIRVKSSSEPRKQSRLLSNRTKFHQKLIYWSYLLGIILEVRGFNPFKRRHKKYIILLGHQFSYLCPIYALLFPTIGWAIQLSLSFTCGRRGIVVL